MIWTRDNLDRLTAILKDSGIGRWSELSSELNIRTAHPRHFVKEAKYGTKATADEYDFESRPYFDSSRNSVVVENPHPTILSVLKRMNDPGFPVFGEYVELDAELAMKVLVLGTP